MAKTIKKKALFFLGMVVTTIVGGLSNFVHSNYSKDGSLFASTAHADIVDGGGVPITGDGCGGDGGGGCSDGCY